MIATATKNFMRSFHTESASVFCGSSCASAPCYGISEDVRVVPIVVTELKFRDVQRHVFCTHLVERTDHAALEDTPETFNRVSPMHARGGNFFARSVELARAGVPCGSV